MKLYKVHISYFLSFTFMFWYEVNSTQFWYNSYSWNHREDKQSANTEDLKEAVPLY